jgi:hypothetical protein
MQLAQQLAACNAAPRHVAPRPWLPFWSIAAACYVSPSAACVRGSRIHAASSMQPLLVLGLQKGPRLCTQVSTLELCLCQWWLRAQWPVHGARRGAAWAAAVVCPSGSRTHAVCSCILQLPDYALHGGFMLSASHQAASCGPPRPPIGQRKPTPSADDHHAEVYIRGLPFTTSTFSGGPRYHAVAARLSTLVRAEQFLGLCSQQQASAAGRAAAAHAPYAHLLLRPSSTSARHHTGHSRQACSSTFSSGGMHGGDNQPQEDPPHTPFGPQLVR